MAEKTKNDLNKKFEKVQKTPASFDFFVAIHDFIEFIESNSALRNNLSKATSPNKEMKIPTKYSYLKQIYQGLEDVNGSTNADLGHVRYMVMVDLKKIRENNLSDTNSFWNKRELIRKFSGEIYERLNPTLV